MAIAVLYWKQGAYAEANRQLETARAIFRQLEDELGVAQTLHYAGSVAAQQGDYERARQLYRESLETRRIHNDLAGVASLLSNLGIIAWFQGNFAEARRLYEESLALRRELGNRWAIGNSLNNLGLVVRDLGDTAEARRLLEECGELGDRTGMAFSLELSAQAAALRRDAARAWRLAGAAVALRESIGAPLSPSEKERFDRALAAGSSDLEPGRQGALLEEGRNMTLEEAINLALAGDDATKP
jgi:tetratricopeptide (TPR) repeat protein